MDNECRSRWQRHIEVQPEEEQEVYKRDWDYFKDFTKTLVPDALFREPTTMIAIERAQQRDNQDPQEFDTYLDSLEKEFELQPEKERA